MSPDVEFSLIGTSHDKTLEPINLGFFDSSLSMVCFSHVICDLIRDQIGRTSGCECRDRFK